MGNALVNLADPLRTFVQGGNFGHYTTTEDFTTVVSDSGTVAVADGSKALVITPSDGTVADNDEGYAKGTYEAFKFADDKPMLIDALIQFTEANTDDANVMVGCMDAVAANSLLDDGGGPKASYSGAVFFKVDGGTVWQCETSNAGTQTTTVTTVTAGGSAKQHLRIEITKSSSTHAKVAFWIDGVNVANHTVAYASITDVQLVAAVKNGGDNLETLNVFVLRGAQVF